MAAPDMTAAINSLPKILTNIGPSILNGAIIVSTISGQSLINKLTFTCPCSFPLNEYQSGGFLFGPCIALFMLGVLLNQKTWRLVHGCCYRSRAAQHPLSTSLLYWIQIIAQSLIAPIAWLFVSLLDGSYYRCLMAARFCSNIPNCTGSLNQSVCETCVCSLDKVNSDKLISESQFLAWLLLIFTGISACFVTCCVRSFDKYTYVQNNFVEMYREIEEKIFEETAKENATTFAQENSKRFFQSKRINKVDWDTISSLPKVENPYIQSQIGFGKVSALGQEWSYTTLQKWSQQYTNVEDTRCGIEMNVESAS
ncbi:hypothetical protein M3Y95_00602500 [Aphelenchoides besseyi]|nr:hypothetical protein M3Y95_00602500 [Aphelenchoides besseyi]